MKKMILGIFAVTAFVAAPAFAGPVCERHVPRDTPAQIDGSRASFDEMFENRVDVVRYVDKIHQYLSPVCLYRRQPVQVNRAEFLQAESAAIFNAELARFLSIPENRAMNESMREQQMALAGI